MSLYIYILVFLIFLNGCSSVGYQYKGEDGNTAQSMPVLVGAGKANFEYTIVTNYAYPLIESDYPTISAFYASQSYDVNNLKRLDIKLIVDGKEIQPDSEEYEATHFETFLKIDKKDCCEMLGEKLGIDVSKKDDIYGFGVQIRKKYKSLKTLPPQVTVVLSSKTDQGSMEMERKLDLSSYKDNNFIRVH